MSVPRFALVSSSIALVAGAAWFAGCSNSAPTTGPELFTAWACVQCHAQNGAGVPGLGPPLVSKGTHWTRETLTAYLRDPAGFAAKTPRLEEQGKSYRTPMPPVLTKDDAAVARLVDHVLALAR